MCARWTHLLPREPVIGRKRDCDSRVEVSAGDVARAGDESHDQSSPGDAHARESDLAVARLVHYDHAAADEDEEEGRDELRCHLQGMGWATGRLVGWKTRVGIRDGPAEGQIQMRLVERAHSFIEEQDSLRTCRLLYTGTE